MKKKIPRKGKRCLPQRPHNRAACPNLKPENPAKGSRDKCGWSTNICHPEQIHGTVCFFRLFPNLCFCLVNYRKFTSFRELKKLLRC